MGFRDKRPTNPRLFNKGKKAEPKSFKPNSAAIQPAAGGANHIKFDNDDTASSKFKNDKPKFDKKPISKPQVKVVEKKVTKKVNDSVLLQEITALGGSKEDFEWLDELDTEEEEIEGMNGKPDIDDDKLSGQLNKLIKGLGISKINLDDSDSDEQSEEEHVEGEGLDKNSIKIKWEDIVDGNDDEDEEVNDEDEDGEEGDEETGELGVSLVTDHSADRKFSERADLKINPELFKELKRSLFDSIPDWTSLPLPELTEGPAFSSSYSDELYTLARTHLASENELSSNTTTTQSDQQFLSSILTSGTLSDKISALTLSIQQAPLHHVKELNKLLMMMRRNNRRESLICCNSFKDLCVSNLLPSDRKLKFFTDQPLSATGVKREHLVLWYFEDMIKKAFFDFLLIAEAKSHDSIMHSKQNMLTYFYELLVEKPEQEANLLTLLINKMGDKDNKVSSKASYLALQVLSKHPQMKTIMAREIEAMLFRSNLSLRAQHYAIITLNQFVLTSNDQSVANQLIDLYFSLFRKLMSQKVDPGKEQTKKLQKDRKRNKKKGMKATAPGSRDSVTSQDAEKFRVITGILTGVNRAFHYADLDPAKLKDHVNILFRIARDFNFNAAIQSLTLLDNISQQQPLYRVRYMKALYESLLDPRLIYSSKQAMFLNLLYKSVKREKEVGRVMAFVKRMLQVAYWHQPPFVNGLLYLVFRLSKVHKVIAASITQKEDLGENSEEEVEQKEIEVKQEEDGEDAIEKKPKVLNSKHYLGRHDEPTSSNAEYTCLWELTTLLHHFHPSVTHLSNQLLIDQPIEDAPHLHLHTLQHFLDRFAYRNAKKGDGLKGSSIMQPTTSSSDSVLWKRTTDMEVINDQSFWKKGEEDVGTDQVFFHRFFSLAKKGEMDKKKKKSDMEEDNEDEEDEKEIWAAMAGDNVNEDDNEDEEGDDEDVDLEDLEFSDEESGEEDEEEVMADEKEDKDEEDELEHTENALTFDDLLGKDQSEEDEESENGEEMGEEDDENEDSDDGDIPFNTSSDDESEEEEEETKSKGIKRPQESPIKGPNHQRNQESRKKRKKLKDLPTFADMDDYNHLINSD